MGRSECDCRSVNAFPHANTSGSNDGKINISDYLVVALDCKRLHLSPPKYEHYIFKLPKHNTCIIALLDGQNCVYLRIYLI